MPEPYRHSVSVAGIVVREDGKILVIRRRDNGHYQAPGGVLEQHERIEEGLVREILEETGLQVEPERLSGIYKHMGLGVVALVFRARLLGGTPTINDEAAEILWMDRDQVAARMTGALAIRVVDALEGPWPHIRHHDGTRLLSTRADLHPGRCA
jgi:ADP-ribose pyrophosphatase YjhB (NUDIX family)